MAFETYGGKTSRSKRRKKSYSSEPIENTKLKIIMTMFALAMVFIGIYIDRIVILFDTDPIQKYVFAIFVLIGASLQYLTVGLKRLTEVSRLQYLSSEQKLTLIIATITVVFAFLNIAGFVNSFGLFATGILIAQGLSILAEIYL